MVLLYSALVTSIIYMKDNVLTFQCHGNDRLIFGYNITSFKDTNKVVDYVQADNDIESNKLMNEKHIVPCSTLISTVVNSCINKPQCSMNFSDSFFNDDPCMNQQNNLFVQVICDTRDVSPSSQSPSASSLSTPTESSSTYNYHSSIIETINIFTTNSSSVISDRINPHIDDDLLLYYNSSKSSLQSVDEINNLPTMRTTESLTVEPIAISTLHPLENSVSSSMVSHSSNMVTIRSSPISPLTDSTTSTTATDRSAEFSTSELISTPTTICSYSMEHGAVDLSCTSNKIIGAIVFASYGTPIGSCGIMNWDHVRHQTLLKLLQITV